MNIHVTDSPALLNPLRDAFARMYSWADDLPGWCDRDEPVAIALQAAEWVRIIYAELEDWRVAEQKHLDAAFKAADKAPNGAPKLILAEISGVLKTYRHQISEQAKLALLAITDHDTQPKKKQRAAERPRCLDSEDIKAAISAIDWWNRALPIRLGRRQRLRSYVADWTLIKLALLEHMPVREVAERVGLDASGSGVALRIAQAITDVAETVGEFSLDLPVPRLEWSRPVLTPQSDRVACYNKGNRENEVGTSKASRPWLSPWSADDRANHRRQYESHDAKLIADFIDRHGVTKCPQGLAEGHGVISIHGKAGAPDARIPVGDRNYDLKANEITVTIPQRALR
jgi:hypothetical protein